MMQVKTVFKMWAKTHVGQNLCFLGKQKFGYWATLSLGPYPSLLWACDLPTKHNILPCSTIGLHRCLYKAN